MSEQPIANELREIVDWSANQPMWQRDALRRLLQQRGLDDDDISELLLICRATRGIRDANEPAPAFFPAESSSLPESEAERNAVSLRAVRNVQRVNALAENQTLKFRHDGLTVVFGHNGSGKSGYARILRDACRARANDTILPNVYDMPCMDAATAEIEFQVAGERQNIVWEAGVATVDALGLVSFFDSVCGNVHVADANEVAYTPTPLTILRQLADVCRVIRQRLESERDQFRQQLPPSLQDATCHPETEVGRLIAQLSGRTSIEEVERLGGLSAQEARRLEALRQDLAGDPARRATVLQRHRNRLSSSKSLVAQLWNATSDQAVEQFRDLIQDASVKRQAAQVAANELFSASPLPGVGSEAWRELWNAARRYSTHAYPEQTFPVVSDDARCLLCQQTLDGGTRQRFIDFEQFVTGDTQRRAEVAEAAVTQQRSTIVNLQLDRPRTIDETTFAKADLEDSTLATLARRFFVIARRRLRTLRTATSSQQVIATGHLPASFHNKLQQHDDDLRERIEALTATSQSDEHQRLVRELHELEDRAWLGTVMDDVKEEIPRRSRLASFESCIADTDTSNITRRSSTAAERLVTAALRDRFAAELNRLRATSVRVELVRDTGQLGTSRFRVDFVRRANVRLDAVLSEGEHRCIALAAFLAELATEASNSGIVFDDPVSSLDHIYRQTFARRIAEESLRRQVIVFTHDLWFVFCLARLAKEVGSTVFYQHICRTDSCIGICDSDPPIESRPVDDAISHLRRRLDQARALYEGGQMGLWQEQARGLLGRIRETWERTVEEILSPVLERFSNEVKTRNLHLVTVLTPDDCTAVDEARASCSRLQHSEAAVAQSPGPTPDAVDGEIEKLEKWYLDLHSRQQRLRLPRGVIEAE